VSRGGNLLLDVGPAADGSIPVVMEERLVEIGSWLRINGDAIYGSHALASPRQYSEGELPKTSFNERFMVPYDVAALVDHTRPGKAAVDAFFTAKNDSVYAVLPEWHSGDFTLHLPNASRIGSVTLLGYLSPLRFRQKGTDVTVALPELPNGLRVQPAWTLEMKP